VKFGAEEGTQGLLLRAKCHPPSTVLPFIPLSFPFSLVLAALGVLRMLPVLQRLGDAYGF